VTAAQRPHPLLHVDLVLLREDVSQGALADLSGEAAALRDLPGVLTIAEIAAEPALLEARISDFDRAFIYMLDSQSGLEEFGTHPRYVRFLQAGLAGAMRSFGGCDARLVATLPPPAAYAGCLALAATPQTFDWQVREAIAGWAPDGACGLALGDRQRYRGIGLMLSHQPVPRPDSGFEGFGIDFLTGSFRVLS
jgi:hypothetical protein